MDRAHLLCSRVGLWSPEPAGKGKAQGPVLRDQPTHVSERESQLCAGADLSPNRAKYRGYTTDIV